MMTMLSLFTVAILLAPGIRGRHVYEDIDPVNDLLLRLRDSQDSRSGLEGADVHLKEPRDFEELRAVHEEQGTVHEKNTAFHAHGDAHEHGVLHEKQIGRQAHGAVHEEHGAVHDEIVHGTGVSAEIATKEPQGPGKAKPVFKPRLGKDPPVPIRPPTVRNYPEKCVLKGGCWCSERTETANCNWPSDMDCETVRTCGPTHPCILHDDMWCADTGKPYLDKPTTNECNRMTTPVYCTTTAYTPCKTFTPPCVHYTPPTTETCIAPTCSTHAPCALKEPVIPEEDLSNLYNYLLKRSAQDTKSNSVNIPFYDLEA